MRGNPGPPGPVFLPRKTLAAVAMILAAENFFLSTPTPLPSKGEPIREGTFGTCNKPTGCSPAVGPPISRTEVIGQ